MIRSKIFLTIAVLIPFVFGVFSPVKAQQFDLIKTNVANRGDSQAHLLNPAIAATHDPLFVLGSKIIHTGIANSSFGLRNNFFSITTSDKTYKGMSGLGFSFQGQVLQTPLLNTVLFKGAIGKYINETYAVGISLGVGNSAFDRGDLTFKDDDLFDPLLDNLSKWIFPEIGIGFLAIPNQNITLGFSVNHLTQPNLSVDGGDARIPIAVDIGGTIGRGYYRGLVGLSYTNEFFIPTISFETFRPRLGYARIGYRREEATFEAQGYVKKGVSINYRFSYPISDLRIASNGSHQFGFVFNFNQQTPYYHPEWLGLKDSRRWPKIDPRTAFTVQADLDTLLVVKRHITRKIDSAITNKELAGLPRNLLFKGNDPTLEPDLPSIGARQLKDLLVLEGGISSRRQLDSLTITKRMARSHSESYLQAMRQLSEDLNQNKSIKARIIGPGDRSRLNLLLDYMSLYGEITDRLSIAILSSESQDGDSDIIKNILGPGRIPLKIDDMVLSAPTDTFRFNVDLPRHNDGPVSWAFIILDDDSTFIKRVSGGSKLLDYYAWDWKLENGEIVSPGTYYYYIEWWDDDKNEYTSPMKPLVVRRENKYINIQVSKGRKTNGKTGDKVFFYLR